MDSWKNIVAVSAGTYETIGLRANGTVVTTGSSGKYANGITDVVSVSACGQNLVCLKADGTVVFPASSEGPYGKTGVFGQKEVDQWNDIIAIAAGDHYTVGLKSDGTVVATGLNDKGQCRVGSWTDIVAISAYDSRQMERL